MKVQLSFGRKAVISRYFKGFLRILHVFKGFEVISSYSNGFLFVSKKFLWLSGSLKELNEFQLISKDFCQAQSSPSLAGLR